MKKIYFFLLSIFIFQTNFAQEYFRLKADFTVKIKKADGSMNLTKGKIYYDKNYKDLIYDIKFPEHEKWIMRDTLLIKIKQGQKPQINKIPSINEFSIFHLALNVSLTNFGLDNTVYQMVKVEKKDGKIISYWKLPNNKLESMDQIIIAKKDNKLLNVIIIDNKNRIINKQFFKDYVQIGAFQFPSKVIQISYDKDNKPNYQVFEFKNIEVNDMSNDNLYHYQ